MNLSALIELQPDQVRMLLPSFLAGFIVDPVASARNKGRISALVADWSDDTCRRVLKVLATVGDEQQIYAADPVCRQLSRMWSMDVILEPELSGVEHLRAAVDAGPTIVLSNHLAYFDSTAVDAILAWSGNDDLADRLMSAAGPKVYQDLFRRVAAACLNTLPVPQSTSFSHTEQLSPRELARRAMTSVNLARDALEEGLVLLIYAEGSRSRSGQMGSFLKGVRRYLEVHETIHLVPAAICGTHRVMPVDDERMHPMHASLRFGPALRVGEGLPARDALVAAHEAIAALLPEEHRPDSTVPPVA